jgi:hypothetical protein
VVSTQVQFNAVFDISDMRVGQGRTYNCIASATDVAGLSASKAFSVTVIVTNYKPPPIRQGAAAFRKSSRPEHNCAVLEFSGAGAASCSVPQGKCRSFSRGTTMIGRLIRDSSQLFYALASRLPK